jgi:hypothetical protein
MPPRYGCNTSGTTTLPSACWKFSNIATIMRGTAHAVAFSVCTYAVAPPLPLLLPFFPFLLLPLPLPASAAASSSAAAPFAAGRYLQVQQRDSTVVGHYMI